MNTSPKTPPPCLDATHGQRVRGRVQSAALLLCSLMAPAMSASPAPPRTGDHTDLQCRLQLVAPPAGSAGSHLQVEVRNTGTQGQRLLRWGTPFEGAWLSAFVTVTRDGVALSYQGAQVKRGTPQDADHFWLGAGHRRRARIAFEPAFDVSAPGRYRVDAAWMWQGPTQVPVAAHCEPLEFTRSATSDRK